VRALVCHHLADDRSGLRLERDWPEPPLPGPGEVTVAIRHAALNYPDLLMLSGGYQMKPELPFVCGTEASGEVIAAGPGTEALLGQEVIVGARGCMAERVTVPMAAVRRVPDGLSLAEAAAFTVGALTAWVGLVERGRLQSGESLLVTGGGGGMGLAAVALGRANGAHVTAAVSSPTRAEAARSAGAHDVLLIDRDSPAFGRDAFDLVFDPVGSKLAEAAIRALRRGGRYLIIGFAGGMPPPLPLNRALLKEAEIIGVRAGEQARQVPGSGPRHIAAIDARAGLLRPLIGLEVPLDRAADAFAAMAEARLTGKAIITV
jgi:NADPH2:quinone reductase